MCKFLLIFDLLAIIVVRTRVGDPFYDLISQLMNQIEFKMQTAEGKIL